MGKCLNICILINILKVQICLVLALLVKGFVWLLFFITVVMEALYETRESSC